MRDDEHAQIGAALGVHALRHDAQGVHVEARVGLVEDGQLGLEQRHLQDLVALLLAAREALVQVPVGERRVELQQLALLLEELGELAHRHLLAARGVDGRAQEVHHRHARHLHRVLHGEEQPGLGALVGLHLGQVLPVEQHLPAGDLVPRVACQRVRQGALARAVGAHERVHLALRHLEVDALQDGRVLDGDLEVGDLQDGVSHGRESPRWYQASKGWVMSGTGSTSTRPSTTSTRKTGSGEVAGGVSAAPSVRLNTAP